MKDRKCIHRLTLPLYARDKEGSYQSSKKLTGNMVYICTKCGAILDRGFKEIEVNSEMDTKA